MFISNLFINQGWYFRTIDYNRTKWMLESFTIINSSRSLFSELFISLSSSLFPESFVSSAGGLPGHTTITYREQILFLKIFLMPKNSFTLCTFSSLVQSYETIFIVGWVLRLPPLLSHNFLFYILILFYLVSLFFSFAFSLSPLFGIKF